VRIALAVLAATLVTTAALGESAAGLHWTAPAGWNAGPARAMRAATYAVPAVAGDTASSECVVYFFGAGQGGSVADNIDRWTGQFTTPSGKPATAIVGKRTAHGVSMTTIDVAGAYSGLGGPLAESKLVSGYRLLGAIVEGPGGNIFVKFTGPAKTIAASKTKFDQLLASFTKGEK
jgi:hypothetical protein